MTILSVTRDVCAAVGVLLPSSVFSNLAGNRTMQEMLACANETAQRIAYDQRDWTRLRTTAVYTGDGQYVPPLPDPYAVWTGSTAFPLPANYKRMLLTSSVWRTTWGAQPMRFVADTDEWIVRRLSFSDDSMWGEWTIFGGQIHIWPIMAGASPGVPAETAYHTYLDKNCVALASGGFGDSFLADGDSFVLDERLLKLGMIADWKQKKGAAYAEDLETFGTALSMAMGHDSPAPILVDGRRNAISTRGGWGAYLN